MKPLPEGGGVLHPEWHEWPMACWLALPDDGLWAYNPLPICWAAHEMAMEAWQPTDTPLSEALWLFSAVPLWWAFDKIRARLRAYYKEQ